MKKIIYTLLIIIALTNNSFSAGTSSDSSDGSSNYTKAKNLIKAAKKYEKKDKVEKAQKRYAKAQKLLLKSNKEKPLQADTLNYLGFTTRKLSAGRSRSSGPRGPRRRRPAPGSGRRG